MSRNGARDRQFRRRGASGHAGTRGTGEILGARAPRQRRQRQGRDDPGGTARALPSWGRRLCGALLLIGTVTLVSCQALFSAVAPELYR